MTENTHSDNHLSIAIFASIAAILLGAMYFLARVGFENPLLPVLKVIGVALLIFCAPVLIKPREAWYASHAALMLYALALVAVLGLLPIDLGLVIAASGAICFTITLIRWWRGGSWRRNLLLIAGWIAITLWLAAMIWDAQYHHPLYLEGLALNSHPPDTLYLASIVKMIQTHGIPATGVHGVLLHRYHTGSHILFALLCDLLRIDALTFYQLGYPVIFIPLFLSAQLIAVNAIRRIDSLRSNALFWLVFFALQVGFNDLHFSFKSESFLVGMSVLLLTVALGASVVRQGVVNWRAPSTAAFALIALPILAFAMGMSKISMIVVLLGLCFYFALRLGLFRYPIYLIAGVLLLAMFGFTYALTTSPSAGSTSFGSPFVHLTYVTVEEQRPLFFVVTYALTWVFIALKLASLRVRTLGDLWDRVWRGELIEIEVVLIAALATVVPIAAGLSWGVNYFTLIARWMAVVFLLANLPLIASALRWHDPSRVGWRSITVRGVALIVLLIVFLPFAAINEIGAPLVAFVRSNHQLRTTYTDLQPGESRLGHLRDALMSGDVGGAIALIRDDLIPYLTTHQQYYEQHPMYQLYAALDALGDLPEDQRRSTVLVVPDSNRLFWESNLPCKGQPFLATALAGMAMLHGFPESGCESDSDFGYADYHGVERKVLDAADHDALCAEAATLGFTSIYIVDASPDASITTEQITCN